MGVFIAQVDAFTDKPFAGNPAAVCILNEPRNDQWMLNVAREMNLAETAFLYKVDEGFNLRWFTPEMEVDLCGHATLASAHILWEAGYLKFTEPAIFLTRSGKLTANRSREIIELNFPALPVKEAAIPEALLETLTVTPKYFGKNELNYLLIEVESEKIVRNIRPDFNALTKIPALGIIITSKSAGIEFDFISRFFAPNAGISEDPVTGSSHCSLGPYWSKRLNKKEMVAYQASARGGELRIRLEGDRVYIGGKAITIFKGELYK